MTKSAFCGWGAYGGIHHITKTLLVMKLTAFLLTITCSTVAAKGVSQNVTFSGKNVRLEKVLPVIERQTGFFFLYKDNTLAGAKPITINAVNKPLLQFLDEIFKSQPLKYTVGSKTINISPTGKPDFLAPEPRFAPIELPLSSIKGKVVDEEGNPLVGATVSVKNTIRTQVTGDLGAFSIEVYEHDLIVISFVGYQTKEIKISAAQISHGFITVSLSKISTLLDETVIIAYGTTTKRNNTGNVTTIKASDIEDIPVTNSLLAIQGRVPGLEIRQSNGLPGAGISIRVQGANSLKNGNDPLVLIDGIPYPSQSIVAGLSGQVISTILGQNGGTNVGQLGSPLNYINPSDIESIEVLKGADATSIYGSRAANGAIIVTTKKGKAGKTTTSFSFQAGIKKIGRKLDLMNAEEYLEMREEALKNDGITTPTPFDYDLNGTWEKGITHDWQKELLGHTGKNMLTTVSVQSGNENLQSLVSGTFYKEDYIFPEYFNKKNDKRGSLHFNITNTSTDKKFKLNFSGNFLFDDNKLPIEDFVGSALTLSPVAPALINGDGTINWQKNAFGYETFQNPMSIGLGIYRLKTTSITGSLNVSYEIAKNLKLSVNAGLVRLDNNGSGTKPLASLSPTLVLLGFPASLQLYQGISTNLNIEPQINYSKKIRKSSLEALAGTTITDLRQFGRNMIGTGFSSDQVIEDLASANQVLVVANKNTVYKYNAAFGRITYNYDNKYLLNLSGRRDGSSKFGSANRFHSFGAIGAAWIFTEEKLLSKRLSFMNYGKLRSSYGTSGNDQISDFKFVSLYNSEPALRPYQGVTGISPLGLTNPFLQWEEIRKFEIGLETAFMNSRISFNVNFALNKSSNQLMPISLPSSAGFSEIPINLPAKVQNKIWEISLSTVNIKKRNLSWTSNITLTLPKNKLLTFPGIEQSTFSSSYIVGKSTNIARLFKSAGVDMSTGSYQFYKAKGNITFYPESPGDDYVTLDMNPDFFGGIQNAISFKNFGLNFNFLFDKRYTIIPLSSRPPGQFNLNQPRYILDRWQKAGDNATYQMYTSVLTNYLQAVYFSSSDKAYTKTTVLRCSNVSLNWELPSDLKKKMGIGACKLYTELLNPFLVTNNNYSLDPETGNALPPLKTINLGIRASF